MNSPTPLSSWCNPNNNKWQSSSMGVRASEVGLNDKVLVEELNNLTCQERERVFAEVHGVSTLQEETPEFIQTCCRKLQEQLGLLPKVKRRAYDRAIFLKPILECDTKFQIMFLRSERYDACRAATRLCSYFTDKLTLFGDEKLVKDITLDDFDEGDMEVFEFAPITILPDKDQSGRTVLFIDGRKCLFGWKEMTRYAWYMFMECLDEGSQRSGVVNISYSCEMEGKPPQLMAQLSKGSPMLMHSLPVRFVGIHCCFDNPTVAPVLSLFQMIIGTQNRIRFRSHFVSNFEAQYTLLTFGIRVPSYLLFDDKEERKAKAKDHLLKRKEIETQQSAMEARSLPPGIHALYPGPKDVLLGRGRPFHDFVGNQKMVDLFEEARERYLSSNTRLEKTFLSIEIYQRITAFGGRFLERVDGQGWSVVSRERGEKKVLRALRHRFSDDVKTSGTPILERMKKKMRRTIPEDETEW